MSRHAVSDLCCFPAARCLAALSDDGSIVLATYEAATLHPLPGIRSDAAVMAGDTARAPARLAVAVRTNSAAQAIAKVQKRVSGSGIASDGHGDPQHVHEAGTGAVSFPSSSSLLGSQPAATKLLVYAVAAGPGGMSVSSGQPAQLLAKVSTN